jgi:hypothetical protein
MSVTRYLPYFLSASVLFLSGDSCKDRNLRDAEIIATEIYGDKQAPLTEQEKEMWREDMGIGEGRAITTSDLRKFLEEHR